MVLLWLNTVVIASVGAAIPRLITWAVRTRVSDAIRTVVRLSASVATGANVVKIWALVGHFPGHFIPSL
ncbi:MAG: hypothetical protein V1867_01730 [Candidatus Falkowbacteria bacterium]